MADETEVEKDLWFLPGPPDEDDGLPPLPRPEVDEAGWRRSRVEAWAAAQAAQALLLADLSWRLGQLDARLAGGSAGLKRRLALLEAADLSWICGDRLKPDRIALWIALRATMLGDDAQALARAGWAFRRLSGGPDPESDIAGFLARRMEGLDGDGASLSERLGDWLSTMQGAVGLHALVRSGLAREAWDRCGLGQGSSGWLEGAVIAARMARPQGAGGLLFVPLGFGRDGQGGREAGPPEARLSQRLLAAEAAVLACLRHLDGLEDWQQAALDLVSSLRGNSAVRLLDALIDWPLLSASMAEELTGLSRSSVHRGLDRLQAAGMVCEVTGQGRFRMWKTTD